MFPQIPQTDSSAIQLSSTSSIELYLWLYLLTILYILNKKRARGPHGDLDPWGGGGPKVPPIYYRNIYSMTIFKNLPFFPLPSLLLESLQFINPFRQRWLREKNF